MDKVANGFIASFGALCGLVTMGLGYYAAKQFMDADSALYVAGVFVILNTLNLLRQDIEDSKTNDSAH